ncbi:right-handed parallel beta-helix repeat-containing protein [Pyxidicoccus xibeiensis]|uniref:hypothetical protein n=1 Tax=Pyxidicoccus xibeiensis TaxID=2906759 RepID=UPI0020A7DFA3|nr:hypothetical protein [Pyxidicoccus xibeiensis]MCP3144316.1 hypothetical protein [Pyxidicoccus xibeiensis]
MRAPLLVAALALLAAACGDSLFDSRGRPDVRVIGPEGGTVTSRDGRVRVTLPPGALEGEETVSLQELGTQAWSVGMTYALEPSGLTLALPARVEMRAESAPGHRGPASLVRVTRDGLPAPMGGSWSEGTRSFGQLSALEDLGLAQPACTEPIECADGFRCEEGACRACPANVSCRANPALPGPHNTGVPAGTSLVRHEGDLVLDTPGAVLEDRDIHGRLIIRANNVTVRRCVVHAPVPREIAGIISVEGATGVLLEDIEVFAEESSTLQRGVMGGGFTARRLDVHGVVVGMNLKSGARVEHSWIHALDPVGAQYGISIFEGRDIGIYDSNVHGPGEEAGAAVFVNQQYGPTRDVRLERNRLDRGSCIVNLGHAGGASLSGMVVRNNVFGARTVYDCAVLVSTQTQLSATGNAWEATGVEVPIERHD